MSSKQILGYNISDNSAPFMSVKGKNSPFKPQLWASVPNYFEEINYITASQHDGFGGVTIFPIQRSAHFTGRLLLQFQIGALGGLDGLETYARFVDGLGIFAISSVELRINGEVRETIRDLRCLYERLFMKGDIEQRQIWDDNMAYNKSNAERAALALAAQEFYYDIPIDFTKHPSKYFMTDAVAGTVEIAVNWRAVTALVQTDSATATATLTDIGGTNNPRLRVEQYAVTTIEAQSQRALRTKTEDGVLNRRCRLAFQTKSDVTAAETTWDIRLNTVRFPVVNIAVIMRQNTEIAGNDMTQNNYNRFLELTSMSMSSDSLTVFSLVTHNQDKFLHKPFYHANQGVQFGLLSKSFAFMPDDESISSGLLDIKSVPNATLTVNAPQPGANATIHVLYWVEDITQESGGDYVEALGSS